MTKWVSEVNGPKGNVLALSDKQIDELPTIDQIIEFFRTDETYFELNDGWRRKLPDFSMFDGKKIKAFHRGLNNNATKESFILNHLQSGRFNLQPNLRTKQFLFRGQNEVFPLVISGFDLLSLDEKLIANLRYDEFYLLLKSHPLCRMFDHGIVLDGLDEPIFFETNYYGFAQHYGFKTGLIDFSCDIDVSAFFAVTKNCGDDIYEVFNDPNIPYGVIYTWDINPDRCFSIDGFSTVGKQYVPRCGTQKGFFKNPFGLPPENMPLLLAFPFKHIVEKDRQVYDYWGGGNKLFPADEFSSLAHELLHSNTIGLQAFAYNKYINPRDDYENNIKRCIDNGIKIDVHKRYVFTEKLLSTYYSNAIQYWNRFCENIYIGPKPNHQKALDSLKNLPHSPYYRHFFDPNYYHQLYYGQVREELKNSRK